MRRAAAVCAAIVVLVAPLSASAQQHRGGGAPAPQMRAPAPPPHMRAPAPAAPMPVQRGFNLNNDVRAGQAPARPAAPAVPFPRTVTPPQGRLAPPAAQQRPTAPQQRTGTPAQSQRTVGNTPRAHYRPPVANQAPHGRVVANRQYHGGNWGWNHGVAWNPARNYWGGGFWGPFALASLGAAFGEIIDDDNQQPLYSYQVEPDSPGADLLANYGLTQEPCGDPNLVVIFGPDQSVICADPNDQVPTGEYDIDTDSFTLVALNS